MDSIINEKGMLFYEKRKKELYKYFYVAPIFIVVASLLFVIGARNTLQLYLSVFLIFILSGIFVVAMFLFAKRLNRTISGIELSADNNIKFSTFSVLFLKSIVVEINRNELKMSAQKFRINFRETEEGWKVALNCNKHLYLYKNYFDKDIISTITQV